MTSTFEVENESILIERALLGEEESYQKILNLYKARVFSFVYRLLKHFDDAEEITFETFINCFKSLNKYDRSKKFSTWLFTIAHNLAVDHLRKQKVSYEYIDESRNYEQLQADIVKQYEKKQKVQKIELALAAMPPLDSELIILFHKEEMSYQEISEIVRLPVTTIKVRLHRARKKLKEMVKS